MIILAILVPPLAVLLSTHNPAKALVNFLLWCCLLVPGIIHGLMIVSEEKHKKQLQQSEQRIIAAQRPNAPPR